MKPGSIEYKMPKAIADEFLKTRKGEDKNMNPQDYLIKCVNEEYGLLHNCVKVIVFE